MAKKPKRKSAAKTGLRSKPISFRLDNTLVDHLDAAAGRVKLTRNRLVAQVLKSYVVDHGEVELDRIAKREAEYAKLDIFA